MASGVTALENGAGGDRVVSNKITEASGEVFIKMSFFGVAKKPDMAPLARLQILRPCSQC